MIAECLSFVLLWSSLLITDFSVPDFEQKVMGMKLSNLSCSNIKFGAMSGTFNSSLWSLETKDPSDVTCAITLEMGDSYWVQADVALQPSQILLSKTADDTCYSTNSTVDKCDFSIIIGDVALEPEDKEILDLIKAMRKVLENEAKKFVCGAGIKSLQSELQNHTLAPPEPHPQLKPDATPLESSVLFRTLVNVINNAPPILGIQLGASLHASTTLRLNLGFTNGLNFQLDDFAEVHSFVEKLADILKTLELEKLAEYVLEHLPAIEDGFVGIKVPQPFNVSLEVSFNDLQCDADGFHCSVPRSRGIVLDNIRTANLGEWDRLIVNSLGPLVAPLMNNAIEEIMGYINATGPRFYIPVKEPVYVRTVPPIGLLVCMSIAVVILIAGTVGYTIWRHKRTSVTTEDGAQISLKRVLIEDLVLMTMCAITAFGFTWSNSTNAAALRLGDEMHIMSFSLMESTKNMIEARVYAFAILVFAFSGVYPYIKLVTIIVCTLVLEKPELVLLKVIDYFGKFSFLDSYAMLVMSSGLQLEGVAEVEILPGFYAFLASTILSILVGNYATTVWRRNTSLRVQSKTKGPFDPETPELEEKEEEGDNQEIKQKKNTNGKRRLILRIFNFVFIAACIIPAWVLPCLRYSVTGLASVVQPVDREMSLSNLGMTNWLFLLTCILTIGIAPVVYGTMYPRCPFLASWSAADALLLACVAGLVQIEQFVDYMLGGNMGALYGARAHLLWPLLLLLLGSVWQWILAAEHSFGLTARMRRCIVKRRLSQPTTEA